MGMIRRNPLLVASLVPVFIVPLELSSDHQLHLSGGAYAQREAAVSKTSGSATSAAPKCRIRSFL